MNIHVYNIRYSGKHSFVSSSLRMKPQPQVAFLFAVMLLLSIFSTRRIPNSNSDRSFISLIVLYP